MVSLSDVSLSAMTTESLGTVDLSVLHARHVSSCAVDVHEVCGDVVSVVVCCD